MELYLIRHGQSRNNALADIRLRDRDPELTALGQEQARRVGEYLAAGKHLLPSQRDGGRPAVDEAISGGQRPAAASPVGPAAGAIQRLFCSPMVRALQTAVPIGRALGLRPEVWIEVHEFGGIYLDHGDERGVVGYPGQTRAALAARFPECGLPAGVGEDGWWRGGMEDFAAGQARAARVADCLREWAAGSGPEAGQRLALVSHGGFLGSLLQALGRQPCAQSLYCEHGNTGITGLSFRPDGMVLLLYANRLDHLSDELIS
ncbi:MAG: histidine phosphatase family protein [Candidatus Latescibacterota bacterium]